MPGAQIEHALNSNTKKQNKVYAGNCMGPQTSPICLSYLYVYHQMKSS